MRARAIAGGSRPRRRADRVRAHGAARQRAAAAAPAPDRAGRVDQRHITLTGARQPASPLGQRARPLVPADVLQDRVLAGLLPDPRVHLVPVAELVHQPGLLTLSPAQPPPVHPLPPPPPPHPPPL